MKRGLVFVAVLLAGCATQVKTTMLDERTAFISGRGNAFNSQAGLNTSTLLAAATEAQKRGYAYFRVVGSADRSSTSYYTSPTTYNTNATGNAYCYGAYCSGNASATTTQYGGQAYAMNHPGVDITVEFFREGEKIEPNGRKVWSVASVLAAHAKK